MSDPQALLQPRLPARGEFVRGIGTLVAVVPARPEPPPPSKDYLFRAVSAHGEIRRRGRVLETLETDSDFYGLGTSVTGCIEEMRQYCLANEVRSDSEVEVVVVRKLEHRRLRVDDRLRENFYAREFRAFKYLDFGSAWDVPEDFEEDVWSSREPEKAPPPLPELPAVETAVSPVGPIAHARQLLEERGREYDNRATSASGGAARTIFAIKAEAFLEAASLLELLSNKVTT